MRIIVENSRNPLKSGLLSYPYPVVAFFRSLTGCRNPLKSGLLSYPLLPPLSFATSVFLSQSPQIGAAVLPI